MTFNSFRSSGHAGQRPVENLHPPHVRAGLAIRGLVGLSLRAALLAATTGALTASVLVTLHVV